MKKTFGKIISLILSIATALSVSACSAKTETKVSTIYSNYYEGINMDKRLGFFVKDGRSDYDIVIPKNATATEKQAAEELKDYVFQTTGVAMSIVSDETFKQGGNKSYFSIGRTTLRDEARLNTQSLDLNTDGFVLKTHGENIIVDAHTDRGFLYGTYEYIEKMLGVKWIAVDETYIPKSSEIPVYETSIISVPAFEYRNYLSYDEYPGAFNEAFASHSRSVSNWVNPSEQYGGDHEFYSRGTGTHNARLFIPVEKYGDAERNGYDGEFSEDYDPHPEFYIVEEPPASAHRGKEWSYGAYQTVNWANGITEDGKLDETMEISAAKVVIEEMKKDIVANPQAKYFTFELEDNFTDPVQNAELVEKYNYSGVVIRFCNVVATELQKWADAELGGREVNLVTFAYGMTQNAPVKFDEKTNSYQPMDPTVVPVDNLYIRLAYSGFNALALDDNRQSPTTRAMAESWSSICDNFFFWGYDIIAEDYLVYNSAISGIYGTVQMLKRIGVDYVMVQGAYNQPNDWQTNMKHYIWSKLFWNPNQEVNRLLNEYLTCYYGVAAPYVKELVESYEALCGKIIDDMGDEVYKKHYAYWTSEILNGNNLSVAFVNRAIELVELAEQRVKEDTEITENKKQKLLKRLSAVKTTPIWTKLKYYQTLMPLDTSGRTQLAVELSVCANNANITLLGEVTNLTTKLSTFGI